VKTVNKYCCNNGMMETGLGHVYHGNYSWQITLYPVRRRRLLLVYGIRLFVALLHCLVDVHDTPEKYELNPGALMIGDRARARLSFASRWGNGRAVSWMHRFYASSR
jgi:hypothetical protein